MWQNHKELTDNIISLVRKKRVCEAQQVLDGAMADVPELAAGWFILAKLLVLGGKEREESIKNTLGEFGVAPQKLFSEAMDILNSSEETVNQSRLQIKRLSLFLEDIRSHAENMEEGFGQSDLGPVEKQQEKLEDYLGKVRGYQARRQLDVAGRTVGRLNMLASGLVRARQKTLVDHPIVAKLNRLSFK
jgi:hypothetical protein